MKINPEPGFYPGFLFGGEIDPKKNFWSQAAARKIFLGLLGGVYFEKIVFRIAEIAFLNISNLH